jgi:hypothetical protein
MKIKNSLHTCMIPCKTMIAAAIVGVVFLVPLLAKAQPPDSVKMPIYSIQYKTLKTLLGGGKKSKLTTAISFKTNAMDLQQTTELLLYGFSKTRVSTGPRRFVLRQSALLKAYVNLPVAKNVLLANTEIKLSVLKSALANVTIGNNDTLLFVPEIAVQELNGTRQNCLLFKIIIADGQQNIVTDYTKLAAIAKLNPCPPARPADYQ